MDDELLGRQSAIAEAHALYGMIGDEHTVEKLRELIAVTPLAEQVLRAYVQAYPGEAYFVDRALKFRASVLEEFERLVRKGVPVANLPEVEETELDASEEALVGAQL
jgi:hypothetical protein